MFVLGRALHARGELPGDAIVGTVMSNIGLERALAPYGVRLLRAPVGDRYVLEQMRAGGYLLGGEQSGHIINLHNNTTGDGPMTAIALFSEVVRSGKTLHELCAEMVVYPQILVNVKTARKDVLQSPSIRRAVEDAQALLAGTGRLLIRPSGTEPLIRVMIEGENLETISALANDLAAKIAAAATSPAASG
jgi:phosphoglucosamine mutase